MTREEIALNIACDLLVGSVLYGYDYDRIFNEIMEKDGVVSMLDIKEFILDHIEELGKEYFVEGIETASMIPSNSKIVGASGKIVPDLRDGWRWKEGEQNGEHQT